MRDDDDSLLVAVHRPVRAGRPVHARRRATCASMLLSVALFSVHHAVAEDGYDLWLRYPLVQGEGLGSYRVAASELVPGNRSPVLEATEAELARALTGLLGAAPP